ncbi:MAG: hypothetical protein KDA85_10215 [Planctomycetaceae bacterium]|nr:hypothetical protein [Planctomycetaceae bacterium]
MNDSQGKRAYWHLGIAIGVCIVLVVFVRLQWRDTTQRGVLADFRDWPKPVQQLKHTVDNQTDTDPAFDVYLMSGYPGQDLSTVVCRIDYSAQTFATLQTELQLSAASQSDIARVHDRMNQASDNQWWPAPGNQVDYFADQSVINGDEGPLFRAAIDASQQKIFVLYEFNF